MEKVVMMSSQQAELKNKVVPDISLIAPAQGAFDLSQNFDSHLDWARSVPHEQALQAEAKKLKPLFSAMVEHIENGRARKHKTVVRPHDLETAFVRLGRRNNSLILCDMPITLVNKLEQQAENSHTDPWETRPESSTFFPSSDSIRSYRGWGFMQIYRADTDTRVSLPVLGLSDKYPIAEVLAGERSVIDHMQNIGRLSNHDWLHHMTMTNLNNLVAYTKVSGAFEGKIGKVLRDIPNIEGKTIENYEALCVKTHSN